MLKINDLAPNFMLMSDSGQLFSLSDLKGKWVVLYFYPKDNTSGCTAEACDFRDQEYAFRHQNAIVLGVSKDSLKSHAKFRADHELTFPLLSDESGEICEKYGVWGEKSMYGKKYFGINRTTFLINPEGKIAAIWEKVKVPDHVSEVLKKLTELKAS